MEELVTLVAFREQLLACLLAIDQVTDALERNPLQNENATVWSQRLGAAAQTIHELHEHSTLAGFIMLWRHSWPMPRMLPAIPHD
jgi:hypothetical protein